jgi:thiamine-phosphate pyrophosphorylase
VTTSACQLYLVVPADAPQVAAKLGPMLAGGHIACLLLTANDEGQYDPAIVRPLVKLAQGRGVAVLLADDAVAARLVGADGVHLADNPFDYNDARRTLGPKGIVGVEIGLSRHDAMELGERGADYVAFAESDEDPGEDAETGVAVPMPERIAWWAEVFTVPCIAWDMITTEDAAEYAALGADFVAIAPEAWLDAANPASVIDAFAEAVAHGLQGRLESTAPDEGKRS